MSDLVNPTKISANRTIRQLVIEWNGGHQSVYPFGLLRAACPCATCRGGHENMRSEPDPEVFEMVLPDNAQTQIRKVEAVGTYAISFEWEDGHHFGIYNWHFLRALCPCSECRKNPS